MRCLSLMGVGGGQAPGLQLKQAARRTTRVLSWTGENPGLRVLCLGSSRWRLNTRAAMRWAHRLTGQTGFSRTTWTMTGSIYMSEVLICPLRKFLFFQKLQRMFLITAPIAREIMIIIIIVVLFFGGGEEMIIKPCYNIWGRTANIHNWLGPFSFSAGVLLCLYISLQSSPLLVFYSGEGGWGFHVGLLHETGRRKEQSILLSSNQRVTVCIYLIVYICDENALAFCVTLPLNCTTVLHSVFQCW